MSMAFQLAQLRHAYKQLKAGRVKLQAEFADGLIAPVIRALEEAERVKQAAEATRFERH